MAKIYCFGNTANGELGLGGIEDEHILLPRKQKLPIDVKRYKLIQLSSGRNHTLVLLHNHTNDKSLLLSCGLNDRFQLGRSGSWRRLEHVEGLNNHFVVKIACGSNHSIALTEAGQLFTWGCNLFGQLGLGNGTEESVSKPSLVKKLAAEFVIQIACGGNHNLALTKCGLLYSWGSNAFGQLGNGNKGNCENVPCQVISLRYVPIRILSAGGSHSAILSHTGTIYLWGKNEFGQLGLNDTKHRLLPTLQCTLRSQRIMYISCGDEHTVALTCDGGLFTWGAGMYGQLGHGRNSNEILPRRVFELMGSVVTQVSCGRCHTLAAVGKNGRVYAFGLNGSGQLGIGTQMSKAVPVCVSGPWIEIGIKDMTVRNMGGSVLPFVKEEFPRSPKNRSKESSPKKSNAKNGSVSDVSIDEMDDDDESMSMDDDNLFNPIVEEPEDENIKLLKREPSFVCTPNTVIFTRNESIEIDEYVSDLDSDSETNSTRQQLVLYEIVSSIGDQSFVLVTRLNERSRSKDFCIDNAKPEIICLNNSILETLKSISKDDPIPYEIVDYIECVFGSIPCLNSSYIEHDGKHLLPLIDWNSALHGFHCIEEAENSRISDLILQLLTKIIPDLPSVVEQNDGSDAEIVRIFILLPLFHVFRTGYKSPDIVKQLIGGFSKAVSQLNENALEVLSNWWSKLEQRHFKELITIYKKSVIELMDVQERSNEEQQRINPQQISINPQLHENLRLCLEFLARLNKINQKHIIVSYKEFYIDDISERIDVKLDYIYWLSTRARQPRNQMRHELYFCDYPFVFDPSAKTLVLATDSAIQQQSAAENSIFRSLIAPPPFLLSGGGGLIVANPYLVISVTRNNLLQETINQLCYRNQDPSEFKKPLKINFEGEEAIDAGAGMKKEFFLLLMKEMLDPKFGMFNEFKDTNTIWFNAGDVGDPDDLVMYHLIGIVCGLAIYNHVIIYLPFPLVLYKKILNEPLDIDDMIGLDPLLVKSLKEILNPSCGEEEFNAIYSDINFVITLTCYGSPIEYELEKNGKEKSLNWNNRNDYVHLYWDFFLNKSVEKQFTAFKNGFNKVVNPGILQLFHAEELMQLVTGQDAYDWNVLEKHGTEYKLPFNPSHPTIIKFWSVFHDLTLSQKKKFLLFLTGSDRIPILGMKALKILIQPMKVSGDHLPVAHTCFNVLDLPEDYTNEEKLKEKLLQAIEHTQGFALA